MPVPTRAADDKVFRLDEAEVPAAAWPDRNTYVAAVLNAGPYGLDFDECPMEFQTSTAADAPLDPVWCLPYGIPEVLTWHDTYESAWTQMTTTP